MEALILIMVVVILYLIGMRMTKAENELRDEEIIKLTDMLDDIHISPYKSEPKAVKKKTKRKVKKAVKKVSPKKKKVVPKKKTKTKRKRK